MARRRRKSVNGKARPRAPAKKRKVKPPTAPTAPAPERASEPSLRGRPFPRRNDFGKDTRFKAGQSGNPGGVPADVRAFREEVRKRTMVVLDRLDDVLDHGTEEGIIKASREILANAWPRALELTGAGGGPIRVTYDDVRRKLTEMAERALAGKAAGDPAAGADAADAGSEEPDADQD